MREDDFPDRVARWWKFWNAITPVYELELTPDMEIRRHFCGYAPKDGNAIPIPPGGVPTWISWY